MESEDDVKEQLEQTQASLTDKLERLQDKVIGTVEDATGAVSDTVEAIKETVQNTTSAVSETVGAVKDSVKDTVDTVKETVAQTVQGGVDAAKDFLNVPRHVQRHPWAMVGGSFAAGFVLGRVFHPSDSGSSQQVTSETESTIMGQQKEHRPHNGKHREKPSHHASAGGFLSTLFEQITPELKQLRGVALSMAAGLIRDSLVQSLPKQSQPEFTDIFDRIVGKLRGEREGHHRKGGNGAGEGGREREETRAHRRNLGHFDRH